MKKITYRNLLKLVNSGQYFWLHFDAQTSVATLAPLPGKEPVKSLANVQMTVTKVPDFFLNLKK